jgi:hypothetical protein
MLLLNLILLIDVTFSTPTGLITTVTRLPRPRSLLRHEGNYIRPRESGDNRHDDRHQRHPARWGYLQPFSASELLARIEAVLRRAPSNTTQTVYEFGGLRVDVRRTEVTLNGQLVRLTAREFQLLRYFVERPVGRCLELSCCMRCEDSKQTFSRGARSHT